MSLTVGNDIDGLIFVIYELPSVNDNVRKNFRCQSMLSGKCMGVGSRPNSGISRLGSDQEQGKILQYSLNLLLYRISISHLDGMNEEHANEINRLQKFEKTCKHRRGQSWTSELLSVSVGIIQAFGKGKDEVQ